MSAEPNGLTRKGQDRRKFERKPVNVQVTITFPSPHKLGVDSMFKATLTDVSEVGMGLLFKVKNRNFWNERGGRSGSAMEVSLPKIFGTRRLQGEKAWGISDNGHCRAGVTIEKLEEGLRNQLRFYLNRPSATKYTIGLYQVEWRRSSLFSILGILRDAFILSLPFRPPRSFVKLLYQVEPKFTFYVHPRRKDDIFVSFPPLRYFKNILPTKWLFKIATLLPPFVIGKLIHGQEEGVVIATLQMPNVLMSNVKYCIKKAWSAVRFTGRICSPGGVLGLGAWWPMATRRGAALELAGKHYDVRITNGHCGTLVSIFLMIEKIAKISNLSLKDLHVGIVGIGKMGKNVAYVLNGKVNRLTLIDIHNKRLANIVENLSSARQHSSITSVCVSSDNQETLQEALRRPSLFVCTTSNIRKLVIEQNFPEKFVVIDDSRPEAFFRCDPLSGKIILEGGLMKLEGAEIDYDYGFGIDHNVFGCLAESYCLALDGGKTLKHTIGDVDLDNFKRMTEFCRQRNISVGDFKSAATLVQNEAIAQIILEKHHESTIT